MRFEIRGLAEDDLDEVAAIEKRIFSLPWTRKGFEDSLHSPYTKYLVVVKEGQVIGYCGYLRSFEEADITNVAVDGAARRCGVGETMLRELMRRGSEEGVERFTLEVRASNKEAIRLYEKLGFHTEGIRPGFYTLPKEDALIMWTSLGQEK